MTEYKQEEKGHIIAKKHEVKGEDMISNIGFILKVYAPTKYVET